MMKKMTLPKVNQIQPFPDLPLRKPLNQPTPSRSIAIWQKNGGNVGGPPKKMGSLLLDAELSKPLKAQRVAPQAGLPL